MGEDIECANSGCREAGQAIGSLTGGIHAKTKNQV